MSKEETKKIPQQGLAGLNILKEIEENLDVDPIKIFYDRVDKVQYRTRKTKKKERVYFPPLVEEAVVAFIKSKDNRLKNKIYGEYIMKPMNKMIENLIHTFKTYYFIEPLDDVKHMVIVYYLDRIYRYDPSRGRAFSFLSVIGKNYLIQKNKDAYDSLVNKTNGKKNSDDNISLDNFYRKEKNEEIKNNIHMFVKHLDNNMETLFPNRKDRSVVESFIELYNKRELIEDYNKKSLYVLIRERTNMRTSYITKVLNKIKVIYKDNFDDLGDNNL